MKNIIISLLLLTLGTSLNAQQTQEAKIKEIMIQKTEVFFAILQDQNNTKQTREAKVLAEIEPLFDFKLMARFSLKKAQWKSLSKAQKSEFSEVFISRIKKSYLNKLDVFADTKVEITESTRVKKKRIEVTAALHTKADTKKLVYKFYQTKKKNWLIYDISIVGVSFLQSYRAQYSSYLKEHSFEELLETLKRTNVEAKI